MYFKNIDKFFNVLKQLISIISFVFIALASYFFIYWLLYNGNVPLPDAFTTCSWQIIDAFTFGLKRLPIYSELLPVLPVLVSVIFIVVTYILNCLIEIIESNRIFVKKQIDNKRIKLEKKINTELHKDFLNELKLYKFMLVKMKVIAEKQESYLTALNENNTDTVVLASSIQKNVYFSVNSPYIKQKTFDNGTLSFLIEDFEHSKDFISELVGKSVSIINKELCPKVDISFYCGAELFHNVDEYDATVKHLDKILNLKIKNRISVTPKFKVYFENLLPDEYIFDMTGEYNLSDNPDVIKNITLHSIRRK